MKRTRNLVKLIAIAFIAVAAMGTLSASHARHGTIVSGHTDVNVWIDGGDVFPEFGDVTFWVRAERDCFTTLFLVDTAGYIHVLPPHAVGRDGWVRGGRAYCYRAQDLGFGRFDGSGIAYVFAVGSPVPFQYASYGADIYVGGFGLRIFGDPFIASRDFYMTLLPASCRWDLVGVSYARFYVRQWTRYPAYLCYGRPAFHVRSGDGCRMCENVYASYRAHCAAPLAAIRPVPRFKETHARPSREILGQVVRAERTRRDAPSIEDRDENRSGGNGAGVTQPLERKSGRAYKETGRVSHERVISTSRSRETETHRAVTSSRSVQTEKRVSLDRSSKTNAHGRAVAGKAKGNAARVEKGARKSRQAQ